MDKQNKGFDEVLSNAKKLGYAESNPSADLNGDDVSSKLKILSSLCFNSFLNNNIYVEGIKDIDKNVIDKLFDKYRLNKQGDIVHKYDDSLYLNSYL